MSDHDALQVAYVEDNPLWVLVSVLLAAAALAVIAILAACYLAGVWAAGRVGRWAEGRAR